MDGRSKKKVQSPGISRYSKKELKTLAKEYALDSDGSRSELVDRIKDHLTSISQPLLAPLEEIVEETSEINSPVRGRSRRARRDVSEAASAKRSARRGASVESKSADKAKSKVEPRTPRRRGGRGTSTSPTPNTPLSQMRQLRDRVSNLVKSVSGDSDSNTDEANDATGTKLTDLLSTAKKSAQAFQEKLTSAPLDALTESELVKPSESAGDETIGARLALRHRTPHHEYTHTVCHETGALDTFKPHADHEVWANHQALQVLSTASAKLRRMVSESPAGTVYRSATRPGAFTRGVRHLQFYLSTPRKVLTAFLVAELIILLTQSIPLRAVTLGPWRFLTTDRIMPEQVMWVPDVRAFSPAYCHPFWSPFLSWFIIMVVLPYVTSVLCRPAADRIQAASIPATPTHRTAGQYPAQSFHIRGAALNAASGNPRFGVDADHPSVYSVHPLTFALARFALIFLFSDFSTANTLSHSPSAVPGTPLGQRSPNHASGPHDPNVVQRAEVKLAEWLLPPNYHVTPLSGCYPGVVGSYTGAAACFMTTAIHNLYQLVPKNVLLLTAIVTITFTFYDILDRRTR
ncbi:hypothetical protein IWQ60_008499 [Tieghemiomyces parasiticus]|uniref:SAP domain-containing protein n=1 Tax=Tieghemiomyces parasiticus TaxID=78921 RepID=A0A9W7ZXJ9_9FUNG|nr:hypothetical protein IWQ60_008499 [Tieghemiomyces parasiticus]